jgi:1,4-dihydroxy-2-naphthoyl-CoA hydrolase
MKDLTPGRFNRAGIDKLPGHLGIVITHTSESQVIGEAPVTQMLMAPNGFLHAGSVVTLADTCAGYGCVVNLPNEASGFTTIELKSNHLGTARDGTIIGVATPYTSVKPHKCGIRWSRTRSRGKPSRCFAARK